MNNIFQFLYNIKGKPIPLEYKLLYNLPLTKEDLIINHDLLLFRSKISYLPDNLTVNGNLDISCSNKMILPNNLTVNGDLSFKLTKIFDLPDDLIVKGNLYCRYTLLADRIKKKPSLLTKYQKQVKGDIYYEIY